MILWLAVALIVCVIAVVAGQAYARSADRCPVMGRPHDYTVEGGGDGYPSHFYVYTCSYCGKQFEI